MPGHAILQSVEDFSRLLNAINIMFVSTNDQAYFLLHSTSTIHRVPLSMRRAAIKTFIALSKIQKYFRLEILKFRHMSSSGSHQDITQQDTRMEKLVHGCRRKRLRFRLDCLSYYPPKLCSVLRGKKTPILRHHNHKTISPPSLVNLPSFYTKKMTDVALNMNTLQQSLPEKKSSHSHLPYSNPQIQNNSNHKISYSMKRLNYHDSFSKKVPSCFSESSSYHTKSYCSENSNIYTKDLKKQKIIDSTQIPTKNFQNDNDPTSNSTQCNSIWSHSSLTKSNTFDNNFSSIILELCLPYLTLVDKFLKIGLLSTYFHKAIINEFPIYHVDFCSPSPDRDVIFYPVFIQRCLPNLPKTLRTARVGCIENLVLIGALGRYLEKLTICNVPSLAGHSSLLSISLLDITSAATKLLNSTPIDLSTKDAVSILMPLRPLAAWLYALSCRSPRLKNLSITFDSSVFPYHLSSNGLDQSAAELFNEDPSSARAFGLSSCMLSATFFQQLVQCSEFQLIQNNRDAFFTSDSAVSSLLPKIQPTLSFTALTCLELSQIVSPLPLTLFLGITLPSLESLSLTTSAAFSTPNLVEFLTVFRLFVLKKLPSYDQRFHSLKIHHASNVANYELLDALSKIKSLTFLKLTSNASYGSHICFHHESLEHLEITCHEQLSWNFELPNLKTLKMITPCYWLDNPISALNLPEAIAKILQHSQNFEHLMIYDSHERCFFDEKGYHSLRHLDVSKAYGKRISY